MIYKIRVKTNKRNELIDITQMIEDILKKSNIDSGIAFLFTPHTTAALTINEDADPNVRKDISSFMEKLIPHSYPFTHIEGNSDSHIKSSLFSCELFVFVEKNRLALGRWQGIYFCEFDGPRNREVWIKVING